MEIHPSSTIHLCHCGCGQSTPLAKKTSSRDKTVRGLPTRYCHGHRHVLPLQERFWNRVKKTDTCWIWTGEKHLGGYGRMSNVFGKKYVLAHRIAWVLTFGQVSSGFCVLHLCDNRICVNPYHLFLGTRIDNASDMMKKGRSAKGENQSKAVLTNEQAIEAVSAYAGGTPKNFLIWKLAGKYGLSGASAYHLLNGRTWGSVITGIRQVSPSNSLHK